MLRVSVLCVGNLKERYWREACAEYEKRLGAFCKLNMIELAEERIADAPSTAQIAQVLDAEGKRMLAKIPAGAVVIPLCIEGHEMSSPQLADRFQKFANAGKSELVFLIGGSHGLSDAVKEKATLKLSMSPMTFPHQLARVMLLEQIYRAFQISSGGKYHK